MPAPLAALVGRWRDHPPIPESGRFVVPAAEPVAPTGGTRARRAAARHALITGGPGTVVVGSVRAVVQRVSPSPVEPVTLTVGGEVDLSVLTERLATMGYDR